MVDKSARRDASLNEAELDDLFAAAQHAAPVPSADLMARILEDARVEALHAGKAVETLKPQSKRFRLAEMLSSIGGWPALAGLATATVAGLAIGIATPDTLETISGGYLTSALGYEFGDLMPALGALIEEG